MLSPLDPLWFVLSLPRRLGTAIGEAIVGDAVDSTVGADVVGADYTRNSRNRLGELANAPRDAIERATPDPPSPSGLTVGKVVAIGATGAGLAYVGRKALGV